MPFATSIERLYRSRCRGVDTFRADTVQPDPSISYQISESCAALCLDPNDETTVEITGLANLVNIHHQIGVPLTSRPLNQSITITHYQQKIFGGDGPTQPHSLSMTGATRFFEAKSEAALKTRFISLLKPSRQTQWFGRTGIESIASQALSATKLFPILFMILRLPFIYSLFYHDYL